MLRLLLCCIILVSQTLWSQSSTHPIHISRTEVNHDLKSKSLQLTLHIFIDDFEDAIVKSGRKKPKILSNNELADADQIIESYLKQKLILTNNQGKQVPFSWVGKEKGDNPFAVWCYLQVDDVDSTEGLKIKNDILLELYDDQINIVETYVGNRPKSTFYIKKIGETKALEF
jgi:hypothetical protein